MDEHYLPHIPLHKIESLPSNQPMNQWTYRYPNQFLLRQGRFAGYHSPNKETVRFLQYTVPIEQSRRFQCLSFLAMLHLLKYNKSESTSHCFLHKLPIDQARKYLGAFIFSPFKGFCSLAILYHILYCYL